MLPLHRGLLAITVCTLALNCPRTLAAQTASSGDPAPTGSNRDATVPPIAVEELPDSPGALWAKSQTSAQQNQGAQPIDPQSEPPAADKNRNNEKLQRPVGTAAAEAPKVSGITAAQPAGAAIAPAKQRRVRIIVLKVGAILGAGAAVGTVIALSAATPSKPPGAR